MEGDDGNREAGCQRASNISIYFEALDTLTCKQENTPVVQVQWEHVEEDSLMTRVSVTETTSDGRHVSVSPRLIQGLVKDVLRIHVFVKEMMETFHMRLTAVSYAPLVFSFLQPRNNKIDLNQSNDKKQFLKAFRKFITRGNYSPGKRYSIVVRRGCVDHCKRRELTSKTNTGIRDEHIKKHSPHIDERFREIEKELSEQNQLIEAKLAEQDRQCSKIDIHLAKIADCLGPVEPSPLPLTHKSLEGGLSDGDNNCDALDKMKTRVPDEENIGSPNDMRLPKDVSTTSEKDKSNTIYESFTDTTQQLSGSKTDFANDMSNSHDPDDLYSQTDLSSDLQGCHYQSSFNRGIQQGKRETRSARMTDTEPLVVPTNNLSYNSQNMAQDQYYDDYDTGSDYVPPVYSQPATYSDKNRFSSVQSEELNFNISRSNVGLRPPKFHARKQKLWESSEGRQRLRMMIECMIETSPAWTRLSDSVEGAMEDATCEADVPRVDNALDTVLCLDTSGSTAGETFEEMKQSVLQFIHGVEAISTRYDIEENIALVTYGGRAKVVHHLSNDYGSVREALDKVVPGGPGPLLEALAVSMACLTKGGLYQVDSNMKLHPRLIVFSDGFPTGTLSELSPDTGHVDGRDIDMISYAFAELAPRQLDDGIPCPVIVVPIGNEPNMECLQSIASNSQGVVTNLKHFVDMAKYQRLMLTGVETLRLMRDYGMVAGPQDFYTCLSRVAVDITNTDTQQIYDMVIRNVGKFVTAYVDKYNVYNIREEPELPALGSRVTRGPDWQWGNQDTEGPGTVLNHASDKMVFVCWDNDHVNVYRYGQSDKYDITLVTDQPRTTENNILDVGVEVYRGPDWHRTFEDQDCGDYGTVIRIHMNKGKVMVRWQNGYMNLYRARLKKDLMIRDPVSSILESTLQHAGFYSHSGSYPTPSTCKETAGDTQKAVVMDAALYQWERMDALKGWEPYTEDVDKKLKREFSKNPKGTCVIQLSGKIYRVSFQNMKERCIGDKSSVPVRQTLRT